MIVPSPANGCAEDPKARRLFAAACFVARGLALCLVVLLGASPDALAWGRKGHAAIAALAERNLTAAAQAEVRVLLADDLDRSGAPSHRTTLAAIASWADEIRDIAPADTYRGWHTRSNPVCRAEPGPCSRGHCVDQLIISYADVLANRNLPLRERNEALKWVVHLVGDLHQPMHSGVSIDGGGLRARIEGRGTFAETTLHAIWDNDIGNLAVAMGVLTTELRADGRLPSDAPTQWMLEARDVALKAVYEPLSGFACERRLFAPVAVDGEYLRQAAVVARAQMEKAGLRLAQLLNQLLK